MLLQTLSILASLQTCEVSVYSDCFHGRRTASGEIFDQRKMTCAVNRGMVKEFPFGTKVAIFFRGRRVIVKVTDTGSYKPKKSRHWFDLSKAAMKKLLGENYNTRIKAEWKKHTK